MSIGLLIIVLCIAVLALLVFRCGTPAAVGRRGERRVSRLLKKLPEEYRLLNDVMLRTRNGRTVQIDHVVVSPYGIFVIETKNYQGIIIGNGNSDEWRQHIWGNEYRLYNPEMQNRSHIFALRQVLPREAEGHIHSIVVFIKRAKLNLRNIKGRVVYPDALLGEITSCRETVFSAGEVSEMYARLLAAHIEDRDTAKTHKAEVRQAKVRRDQRVASGICPLCGGRLVVRGGRYGRFYGCSNYPECRFTMR